MLVGETRVEGRYFSQTRETVSKADEAEALWLDEEPGFRGDPDDGQEAEDDWDDEPLNNVQLGRRGEAAAVRYLKHKGYEIVERNWACPLGEADIVAYDGDMLVFVEVKTRRGIYKGFPAEAVTPEKRRRYERIAAWYLKDHDEALDCGVRFDVIALLVISEDRAMVKHYVNAFGWEF